MKVAFLEKECSIGVAWPTTEPMSQLQLYPGMAAPLVIRYINHVLMQSLFAHWRKLFFDTHTALKKENFIPL